MATKKSNPNFPFEHKSNNTKVSPLVHLDAVSNTVNYESLCNLLLFEPYHVDTPPFITLKAMHDKIVQLKGI